MTEDPIDFLTDVADKVAKEFEPYREQNGFNEISLVIENHDEEHPTLIVHVDREDASPLADRIEKFLGKQGVRTERERHSQTDIRVLATTD